MSQYARLAPALHTFKAAMSRFMLAVGLLGAAGAVLAAPGNTCATAQSLGTLALATPVVVNGALTTPPGSSDVNFYQVTATPGSLLNVLVTGTSDGTDTLFEPLVGVFTSACQPVSGAFSADPFRATLTVPGDGILRVGVTSCCDFSFAGTGAYAGTYTLTLTDLQPVASITGRVVDAVSLAPLPFESFTVSQCLDSACAGTNLVSTGTTDVNGNYEITGSLFGGPLVPGTYQVSVTDYSGIYQSGSTAPFNAAGGQAVTAPTIDLALVPVLSSISGRLVDSVTHAPLSGSAAPFATVELTACGVFGCTVFDASTDGNGRFYFTRDASGRGIPAGASITAFLGADQYQSAVDTYTAGAANTAQNLGDIPVVSNPVRFTVLQGCSDLPVSGGLCTYEVELTNGTATEERGRAWAIISAAGVGASSTASTLFQTGEPEEVRLAPATRTTRSSRTARFFLNVPAGVPQGASICPTFWFGVAPGNPELNPLGSFQSYDSCVQRSATAYVPTTPEQVARLRGEARRHAARERAAVSRP